MMMTTPSTPTIETCRHCGAVRRSDLPQRLDEIKGQEHVKRAIEVAAAGNHTIVLVSIGMLDDTMRLAQIARNTFALAVFVITPCPCGNHGSAERECICTPMQIVKHTQQKRQQTARSLGDLFIEVHRPSAEKLLSARRVEPDEHIEQRIAEAAERPAVAHELVDGAAQRLMQAAMRQLQLDQTSTDRMLSVAATVARLAARDTIGPAHLAEAVQYRLR